MLKLHIEALQDKLDSNFRTYQSNIDLICQQFNEVTSKLEEKNAENEKLHIKLSKLEMQNDERILGLNNHIIELNKSCKSKENEIVSLKS